MNSIESFPKISKIASSHIKEIYKENFGKIQKKFLISQSLFITDIYNRYYKDLDSANIVLYFATNLHQQILRERDNDLQFDISLDQLWLNHKVIVHNKYTIMNISYLTGLPKETARRKIKLLVKKKILKKNENKIYFEPQESDKNSYNIFYSKHINNLSKLIIEISSLLKINLNHDNIKKDINKKFSFYWFHYLKTQLHYFKIWQKKFKDLELLLILNECSIQTSKQNQKNNFSFFFKKKLDNEVSTLDYISATTISQITGIPRATCIRKLNKLEKLKLIKKDNKTKRYHYNIEYGSNNNNSIKNEINSGIDLFSNFYSVVIKEISRSNGI